MSEGEILGLVGESGSGKTTTGRLLVRLEEPDSGEIYVNGHKISNLKGKELKRFYRNVQMIFQDPYESINPRFTVFETVAEPIRVQKLAIRGEHVDLISLSLESSGLNPPRDFLNKFPHELSGGERQRLSIARALVMQPKVLIADEPVSMLDVSIKAGILNLLKSLSKDIQMALLYISHDLSTVKYICDRIIIMYMGKFMEIGFSEDLIDRPQHPYAKALKNAIPVPDPGLKRDRVISNSITEKSFQTIKGCRYRTECQYGMNICMEVEPELKEIEKNHYVACHLF
jgi:oligopeptide/dipeptide ABC transporter ATP-binding protein